ncbi:MAG: thioredoxin domain-containing protein [Planctomycetes bacterium]|nr:thioredoxin domain-containing protein [Planctomycetota bacterium]
MSQTESHDARVNQTATHRPSYRDREIGLWLGYALLLPAGGGLVLSLFLWWAKSFVGRVPGCNPGVVFDCTHALTGKWSQWLGVPVGLIGAIVYGVIFAAVLCLPSPAERSRRAAWCVLAVASAAAVGAGAWFTYLQLVVMHAICPYCIATHACGLIVLLIVAARAPLRHWDVLGVTAAAFLSTVALIGGQALYVAPSDVLPERLNTEAGIEGDTGPGPQRVLTLFDGSVMIRPHEWLVQGSPDAPKLVVEMFDYTCPSCRATYAMLMQARTRYGGQVAVVSVVVPLEPACNPQIHVVDRRFIGACELAKLSLAVGHADHDAWMKFHHWMFDADRARTPPEAKARAVELLGSDRLEKALRDPWVEQQLKRHIELFEKAGGRGVPITLWGPKVRSDLLQKMEFELGLTPVGPTASVLRPATRPSAP